MKIFNTVSGPKRFLKSGKSDVLPLNSNHYYFNGFVSFIKIK